MHKNCRINFRMRITRYVNRCEENSSKTSEQKNPEQNNERPAATKTRSKRESNDSKKVCFVCQEQRTDINGASVDEYPYNKGGLGRCSTDEAAKKIKESMAFYLSNDSNESVELKSAAQRLQVAMCGPSHDIFALDVYYHQSCYLKFTYILKASQSKRSNINENEEIVSAEFITYLKVKILKEQNAYLLKELLEDIKSLCGEHNVQSFICETKSLRRFLEKTF